jgi:hypothetical protein
MTYTKAPWHICEVTGRNLKLIRDANGYCVAEAVKPANSGAAYIDADANAALIAAAPDMLAALESALITLEIIQLTQVEITAVENDIAQTRAAIAKAKGEVA